VDRCGKPLKVSVTVSPALTDAALTDEEGLTVARHLALLVSCGEVICMPPIFCAITDSCVICAGSFWRSRCSFPRGIEYANCTDRVARARTAR
jgi:hypothetical protein